jgi:hypothetical protein
MYLYTNPWDERGVENGISRNKGSESYMLLGVFPLKDGLRTTQPGSKSVTNRPRLCLVRKSINIQRLDFFEVAALTWTN